MVDDDEGDDDSVALAVVPMYIAAVDLLFFFFLSPHLPLRTEPTTIQCIGIIVYGVYLCAIHWYILLARLQLTCMFSLPLPSPERTRTRTRTIDHRDGGAGAAEEGCVPGGCQACACCRHHGGGYSAGRNVPRTTAWREPPEPTDSGMQDACMYVAAAEFAADGGPDSDAVGVGVGVW